MPHDAVCLFNAQRPVLTACMDLAHYMQLAIAKTEQGIDQGQSPFGAVIVREGEVVAVSHNTVWWDSDPTAHAEVNAIRQACSQLKCIDLRGSIMLATCEPCPMCLTAIHWAKIDAVYYGACIDDAKTAGFAELEIPAQEMVRLGKSPLRVLKGPLPQECASLFRKWKDSGQARAY